MSDLIALSREARTFGNKGLRSFPIAYGCWRFPGQSVEDVRTLLSAAKDAGIDHFDTADIYGVGTDGGFGSVEALIGDAFRADPGLRDGITVATKCGVELERGTPYLSSKSYIVGACEASLRRLGLDTIDIFYIHRPDMLAHPAEVAAGLEALLRDGKIGNIAVSNYSVSQIDALQAHLDTALVAHQIEISPFEASAFMDGRLDQAMQVGMTPVAWSPLAGGRLLTGETGGLSEAAAVRLGRVRACCTMLADTHNTDVATIALAFLLAHPAGIVPILGTQNPGRIKEAVRVFDLKLSRRDWYDLVEAYTGVPMP